MSEEVTRRKFAADWRNVWVKYSCVREPIEGKTTQARRARMRSPKLPRDRLAAIVKVPRKTLTRPSLDPRETRSIPPQIACIPGA